MSFWNSRRDVPNDFCVLPGSPEQVGNAFKNVHGNNVYYAGHQENPGVMNFSNAARKFGVYRKEVNALTKSGAVDFGLFFKNTAAEMITKVPKGIILVFLTPLFCLMKDGDDIPVMNLLANPVTLLSSEFENKVRIYFPGDEIINSIHYLDKHGLHGLFKMPINRGSTFGKISEEENIKLPFFEPKNEFSLEEFMSHESVRIERGLRVIYFSACNPEPRSFSRRMYLTQSIAILQKNKSLLEEIKRERHTLEKIDKRGKQCLKKIEKVIVQTNIDSSAAFDGSSKRAMQDFHSNFWHDSPVVSNKILNIEEDTFKERRLGFFEDNDRSIYVFSEDLMLFYTDDKNDQTFQSGIPLLIRISLSKNKGPYFFYKVYSIGDVQKNESLVSKMRVTKAATEKLGATDMKFIKEFPKQFRRLILWPIQNSPRIFGRRSADLRVDQRKNVFFVQFSGKQNGYPHLWDATWKIESKTKIKSRPRVNKRHRMQRQLEEEDENREESYSSWGRPAIVVRKKQKISSFPSA